MTGAEFLRVAVELIERAGVEYMVAGSFASSYYGEARTTRDLDLVVSLDEPGIDRLVALADPQTWYISRPELIDALGARRMANLIHLGSGWKLDLVMRKDRPFSRLEFERQRRVPLLGVNVAIASAEDVLLTKIEWAMSSGSQRQLDDARSIVRVQHERLDIAYLEEWAPRLGVDDLLHQLLTP